MSLTNINTVKSLIDDFMDTIRATTKSAPARAVRHVQAAAPRPHPVVARATNLEQNIHITGTIEDKGIVQAVIDAFDGKGTLIDNTSTRAPGSIIDRMSR